MKLGQHIFEGRLSQVERILTKDDVGGLVVYATGSALGASSRTHGYMRYLCDWDSHHAPSVLVLRFCHKPVLLVPNIFMTFLAKQYHWMEDVRFVKIPDFAVVLADILAESKLDGARLGLVGRNEMPAPVWEAIVDRMPHAQWRDATAVLDSMRVVKDAAQVAMHERAAEICDELFGTLARELRTPKPVYQLQADMERAARYAGCEYCAPWLTAMPKADYGRSFKEECMRVPQRGDQVYTGIYLIYEGHWGHAIRGGTLGPPNDAQRKLHGIALEMEQAMLERLTPGADLHKVHAAAENVLRHYYPGDESKRIFRFRHGHALGLSYEDPVMSAAFPQLYDPAQVAQAPRTTLEVASGMLFELHPNLFVPDVGGGVIGDMVVVTENVPRLLNSYQREIIEW